ncbi:ABC transporter substrate-binding protein [uncultured Sulfitobacter sp.]|uniref:ABC transporter substrate-binding protein n=1 Tax=uncultured Sulfitobacter sp. TaxID=191468 RepID=UPI00262FB7E5|nr:ABC transporter substrate-binding protein [uncultured Sulfitobacter sp.]
MAQAEEAGEIIKSHGYSFYGDLKYPADYPHFEYVNPDAPKGGEISVARASSVDSMNPYNGKGRAGLFSVMHYEGVLGRAPSYEPAPADVYAEYYCLLCETLEYPVDKSWVIFNIRKNAKFSDGSPVTAHDVVFSHNFYLDGGLKSAADGIRKRVLSVEALDDYTVKFSFADGIPRRSLIASAGNGPIWSKAWFEKTGVKMSDDWRGDKLPIGSGPYKIVSADLSRSIVLERREDYWGKDLPFNVGRNNFDRIRQEIMTDDTASFQGFKTGLYTFRQETDSRKWAADYEFPKAQNGFIIKKELSDGSPPVPTGIIFNLGSEVLKDKRIRQAIAQMFNFEWTNESLQYGLFKQRASFSQDTPLMAQGKPQGAELALLQSLGDLVPADMLAEDAVVPHTSRPTRLLDRNNRRAASDLLDEAGWSVVDGKRRNATGDLLEINFLFNSSSSPTLSAVIENFVSNLQAIGINAKLEKVDSSQYTARERDRDYDLVFDQYAAILGTGTGLLQYYGSEAAAFSLFNPAGLASPLVDAIIDISLNAKTAEEENTAITALDRALRYELFMIPVWYNDSYWVAYYDMFEHPENMPPYALGHLDFWWYNADKAQKLRDAGVLR